MSECRVGRLLEEIYPQIGRLEPIAGLHSALSTGSTSPTYAATRTKDGQCAAGQAMVSDGQLPNEWLLAVPVGSDAVVDSDQYEHEASCE